MPHAAVLVIMNERVDLVSVSGRLDDAGIGELQQRLDLLLGAGARYLAVDLAQVTGCDNQLFDMLVRTSGLLEDRDGWLRLVGLGSSVLDVLDGAALPTILMLYRASDWAHHDTRPA